jgi:hypothetical protein
VKLKVVTHETVILNFADSQTDKMTVTFSRISLLSVTPWIIVLGKLIVAKMSKK